MKFGTDVQYNFVHSIIPGWLLLEVMWIDDDARKYDPLSTRIP
jgi:hypothetical protein